MDVYEVGTLDANFLRYGLHNSLQKCPIVANREQWNVARINEKLSAPATRLQGLAVLEAFLPQCSDHVFGENAVSWMQQCLHVLEASSRNGSSLLAFRVLKMLLQMSSHFSELTKLISSSVVSKALEKIVASMDGDPVPALQCLHALMTHYGGACGASKGLVEHALLRTVGSPERAGAREAARCWALLPALGGAGGQQANHKQQWAVMQLRVCNTLHHLLARLLHQYRVLHSWSETDDRIPLPEVNEENSVSCFQKLTKQLCSVSKFLQAMLRGVFPTAKSVSVGVIMEVVCRGLAVNCFSTPNKDADKQVVVMTCMPDIHVAMFGILEALIVCCGRNLIPFGGVMCDLALQDLKWTAVDSPQYASERPFGCVRVAACRVLAAWLGTSKAASLVEKHAGELVAALLSDIQSCKPGITLSVPTDKAKGSAKNSHKMDITSRVAPQRLKLHEGRANSGVCAAALEALHCIMCSSATFVPTKLHKTLQEVVVTLVLEIQRSSSPEKLPVPYSVPECRLGLYRLLEALVMWPHGNQSPPTHFALVAFSLGQADHNCQVSSFCTSALSHMEKVAHPACVSLQFTVAAGSEGPEIVARTEIPMPHQGPQSRLSNGLVSSADDKISFTAAAQVEVEEVDITMSGSEEEDLEEIVVEAVPEDLDDVEDDDDDGDDNGLQITLEGVGNLLQSNKARTLSSRSELIDLADSSISHDVGAVVDESSNSVEGRKSAKHEMPKKNNRQAAATKRNLQHEKASDTAVNDTCSNSVNSVETFSSGSSKEHEKESDHCWTAEEAALVSNIIKDFEFEKNTSSDEDEHVGSQVMTLDESENKDKVNEEAAIVAVSEIEMKDTGTHQTSNGSSSAEKLVLHPKEIRKREASSQLTSTGPEHKRQKTDEALQIPEVEVIEVDEDDVGEDTGHAALKEMDKEHETIDTHNKKENAVVHETTVIAKYQEKSLEQPEVEIVLDSMYKNSRLTKLKEQELCPSQMETVNGNFEQLQMEASKQTEEESDFVQKVTPQLETSSSSFKQAEVHPAKQTEKESDCVAQLETNEDNCRQAEEQHDKHKESDSVLKRLVHTESSEEDSGQVGPNKKQKESESFQDCPLQMEVSDENTRLAEVHEEEQTDKENVKSSEQIQGQKDGQTNEERDCAEKISAQMESHVGNSEQASGEESEELNKETGLVQSHPSHVENGKENHLLANGEMEGAGQDSGESGVQSKEQETCTLHMEDNEVSLVEENGNDVVILTELSGTG